MHAKDVQWAFYKYKTVLIQYESNGKKEAEIRFNVSATKMLGVDFMLQTSRVLYSHVRYDGCPEGGRGI